jgi:hypothetical protein
MPAGNWISRREIRRGIEFGSPGSSANVRVVIPVAVPGVRTVCPRAENPASNVCVNCGLAGAAGGASRGQNSTSAAAGSRRR